MGRLFSTIQQDETVDSFNVRKRQKGKTDGVSGYTSSIKRKMNIINRAIAMILSIVIAFCVSSELVINIGELGSVQAASSTTFNYTGDIQTFTASQAGEYKIKVWGASGGGANMSEGGMGGYVEGTIKLATNDKLYIGVGQAGSINGGTTFGGGGASGGSGSGAGGGASWVSRPNKSTSLTYSNVSSNDMILIAGGGGGKYSTNDMHYKHPMNNEIHEWELLGGYRIGCGVVATWSGANVPKFGMVDDSHRFFYNGDTIKSNSCNGDSGVNGRAGSGGGYRGGAMVEYPFSGGTGGLGYIYKWDDLYNTRYNDACNIGNGRVEIQYLGPYDVTVTIMLGNNATYPGASVPEAFHTITAPCDSYVTIQNPTPCTGIVFTGYSKVWGTIYGTSGYVCVGMGNSLIQANYTGGDLVITQQQRVNSSGNSDSNGNYLKLGWSDATGGIYYKIYKGVDVDTANTELDFETEGLSSELNVRSYTTAQNLNINSTTTVGIYGKYEVILGGEHGNEGSGGDVASLGSNLNGAKHTATMYFRRNDSLSFAKYAGGARAENSKKSGRYSGAGGRGLGLKLNGSTIMAAGGGAGSTSEYTDEDGGHVYQGNAWEVHHVYRTNSTSGIDGANRSRFYNDDTGDCFWASGGGGGGWHPNGGGGGDYRMDHFGVEESSAWGQCGIISSVNGKSTTSSIDWTGSSNLNASLQLIAIPGATMNTSGTYQLIDKQAPDAPPIDGYTVNGSDRVYTVSWYQPDDNGSTNVFQVYSYSLTTGNTVHTSKKVTENYKSGFSKYYYVVDQNSGTIVTTYNSTSTTSTSIQVNANDYSLGDIYIHIAAIDNAGNLGKTSTIRIPGTKMIVFDRNNEKTTNIDGNLYTTTAVGTMSSLTIEQNEFVTISLNAVPASGDTSEAFVRVGYHQQQTEGIGKGQMMWNTKPDGTGSWFYTGEKVYYNDPRLTQNVTTLYCIWEPNRYKVVFEPNRGTSHTGDTTDYDDEYRMPDQTEIHFDATTNLVENQYIRKYLITYQSAEPWLRDKMDDNGNVYKTEWVKYKFKGWTQGVAQGVSPYYTYTDASKIIPDKGSIKNLTSDFNGEVHLYAAWDSNYATLPSQAVTTGTDTKGYTFIDWSDEAYPDVRVYNKVINNNVDTYNKPVGKNKQYTPYEDTTFYAHWWGEVVLTMDMDGGVHKQYSSEELRAPVYDYNIDYTFGILNNPTGQKKGYYEKQYTLSKDTSSGVAKYTKDESGNYDGYGSYDDNGTNYDYTKYDDETLSLYRFLGWSETSGSTEPKAEYNVYNPSRETKISTTGNKTVYAAWEPILIADITMERVLGTIDFESGTKTKTNSGTLLATSMNAWVSEIIRPGEQGLYELRISGKDPVEDNVEVTVQFDSRMADIYNHIGTWTDDLNPRTTEDINLLDETQQKHGLDRKLVNPAPYSIRKFYMPQYIGTSQSYTTSNPDDVAGETDRYYVQFKIQKPSFYWKYVHNSDEVINVTGTIYITTESNPDTPPPVDPPVPITILDELRTRIKTRIM